MAYQTIYPYTNEVLQTYDNASDADLEKALATGHDLYKQWRADGGLSERKAILHKVADLLRRDVDSYAETMTKDMGKLLTEAKGEVELCAEIAYKNMNTDYTATRMLGYLYRYTNPKIEDLVDEMLAILSDRAQIIEKKESEHAQAVISEMYRKGL